MNCQYRVIQGNVLLEAVDAGRLSLRAYYYSVDTDPYDLTALNIMFIGLSGNNSAEVNRNL